MTARRFAIVGPSGAGKDTVMALAAQARADIHLARRVITRPTDAGGEEFTGVTEAEFSALQAQGHFAIDWPAHGLRYGLPRHELERDGGVVLLNASRAALPALADLYPDLEVILVTAPPEVLAARLAARGRETADDQRARLARADFALPEGLTVHVVENASTPEAALAAFLERLQLQRL